MDNLYFEVISKMGKRIRTTKTYWEKLINEKHPSMKGREKEVQEALIYPIEIRKSKVDQDVYMYSLELHKEKYRLVKGHRAQKSAKFLK